MSEHKRFEKAEDYDLIGEDCYLGYNDARAGKELPPSENLYSRSYYHGYLNGLVDSGKRKIDRHQAMFARDLVKKGKLDDIFNLMEGFDQTHH